MWPVESLSKGISTYQKVRNTCTPKLSREVPVWMLCQGPGARHSPVCKVRYPGSWPRVTKSLLNPWPIIHSPTFVHLLGKKEEQVWGCFSMSWERGGEMPLPNAGVASGQLGASVLLQPSPWSSWAQQSPILRWTCSEFWMKTILRETSSSPP